MFLFEFTITACVAYYLIDKCLPKRRKIKRSERTLKCRTHNKYIIVETSPPTKKEIEDAKTLQYFFNKLRVNKQIKEMTNQSENLEKEIITKKMFNKKKNINKKLTKKVKKLEKENKELQDIICNLKSNVIVSGTDSP